MKNSSYTQTIILVFAIAILLPFYQNCNQSFDPSQIEPLSDNNTGAPLLDNRQGSSVDSGNPMAPILVEPGNISTYMAKSISQYNITWTFSQPVEIGEFVNGDYFVIGSVTVDSVSPAPRAGRSGSMLNPVASAPQGLDSTGLYYDAKNSASYPLNLIKGDALISSISLDGTETTTWSGSKFGSNSKLRTAAVLTVLSEVPPKGSFRPSYSDRNQTLYNVNQIKYSILPQLTPSNYPPDKNNMSSVDYYARGLKRPWLLFGRDWQSRHIHPTENMNNYHEQIGAFLSEASVILTTNIPGKERLLINYIQVGIDYYHTGVSDSSFWAWPLIFTGLLLDEPKIYNHWINNPNSRTGRGHEKLYYVGDRDVTTSSSMVPLGQTWVDWSTPSGKYVAFSKQVGQEYEHLHPSEWQCHSPHCKAETYRTQHDVYPLVGLTLASILIDRKIPDLDVNALFHHPPMRDYVDRWMSEGFSTNSYKNTGRTYQQEMEHFTNFTIYFYRYGSGGSDFIDEMWSSYR